MARVTQTRAVQALHTALAKCTPGPWDPRPGPAVASSDSHAFLLHHSSFVLRTLELEIARRLKFLSQEILIEHVLSLTCLHMHDMNHDMMTYDMSHVS